MDARQFEILKKFKRSQIKKLTIFEQKKRHVYWSNLYL